MAAMAETPAEEAARPPAPEAPSGAERARAYDRYWEARDEERARARSLARAELALELLERDGRHVPRGGRAPRLLDAGCGPGWALAAFRARGFDARGLELSALAAEAARRRGLEVEVWDIESRPPSGAYEVVTALEVLEHLAEPLPALLRLKAALAPGGRLVVSLPNELHLLRRLAILAGRAPFGGHDDPHLRWFNEALARRLFAAAGLCVLALRSDPLAPPRRPLLRRLLCPLARLSPGLFALSHVFLLEPEP
jgi:SAM-dependent methyltransferase